MGIKQGIVEFEFEEVGDRFWFKGAKFNNQFLVYDFGSYIGPLSLACDSFFTAHDWSIKENGLDIFELKQFQTQDSIGYQDFDRHIGGDIYVKDEKTLVISFFVKARVLEVDSPPCENFSFSNSYSCPVERITEKYPLYIILETLESRTLSIDETGKKDYQRSQDDSFLVGYCD